MTVSVAFVFVSCLLSSVYCQVVNITVTPSDATLLVGQDLTIQCTTDQVASEVSLRINSETTATNPRVVDTNPASDVNDRTFNFTSVTREDNGLVFTCFIPDNNGISSAEIILIVQFEPVYSFSEEQYTVNEGYRFVAVASVSANPDVMDNDTVWRKDNTVIAPTSNIQCNATTLTIVSASRYDAGNYFITGTNEIGMGNASFDLDVFFGPEFTSNGGRIDVNVGDTLMIDCTTGDSNPAVLYVNISGTDLLKMLPEGNRLYMFEDPVTTEFNGRMYTCTASNGETMGTITYTVYVPEISTSVISSATVSVTSTSSSSTSSTDGPTVSDVTAEGLSGGAIGGIVVGVTVPIVIVIVSVVVVMIFVFKKSEKA